MVLYVNGCSHSRGDNLYAHHTHGYITANSLFGKRNFNNLNTDVVEASPTMYSVKEKVIDTINKDEHHLVYQPHFGKSNDRIFFESVNFLYECIKNDVILDFAVVQWSGPNRTIHSRPIENNSCKLIDVTAHDSPELGLKFEPFASCSTIQMMLTLQDLYKKNNINYVFIPYMELDLNAWEEYPLSKHLDLSRFTVHPTKGYRDYFRKRGWVTDTHGHPSHFSNYYMASKCLDILGEPDSLIGIYDFYGDEYISNETKRSGGIPWIQKHYNKLGDATDSIVNKLRMI